MPQQGYLVISDITGYTAFLTGSELEHAEDILHTLFEVLLEHTIPPLVVSKLEGDAIFSYAPAGSFSQGQILVEVIENMYCAFRRSQERMHLNTTCTCQACRNIPNLDLKFFIHFGTFSLRDFGGRQELSGTDVILIHRLLKNTVTETNGINAYALWTQSAIDALGIQELCVEMQPHVESYEHLGEINLYVLGMHSVWETKRDVGRVFVTPEAAMYSFEYVFPFEAALVWDYLTNPEYRAYLLESDHQKLTGLTNGRTKRGAVYHCAHGRMTIPQTIVDWQPFDYYTIVSPAFFPNASVMISMYLSPDENGTRMSVHYEKSKGFWLVRPIIDFLLKLGQNGIFTRGCQRIQQEIDEKVKAGGLVQVASTAIPESEISAAIHESMVEQGTSP